MKIFGREPTAWVELIEGVLAFLSTMVFHLSGDQTGAIMAVVVLLFGGYTAWVTHDTMLGVIVGLIKAVAVLFLAFGVTLPADKVGALIALVTVVSSFWHRTQTFPVAYPPAPLPGATAVSEVGTG